MRMARIILAVLMVVYTVLPATAFAKKSNDPQVDQWGYEDTGVYRAWDMSTGSSDVVVAVIDNGFDSGHPDLRDNVWINTKEIAGNGKDDDKNGYVDDVQGWNFALEDFNGDGEIDDNEAKGNNNPRPVVDGLTQEEKDGNIFSHGTVVAGIIGAVGNNEQDGAGINWKVKLMNVKVLDNSGIGFLDNMPAAIRYAADNGAHVINISIVGGTQLDELDAALKYAYDKGVFVVVASGNDYLDLNLTRMYPVCSDADSKVGFVIGTGAVDKDHHAAEFSNTGSDCVDIAAPGVGINSTIRYSPKNGLKDSYGFGWDGTSFASPFIAGAAALVKSVRPDWKAPEIADALLRTVHHTPSENEAEYANLFGAGLLQVDKAVAYALSTRKTPLVNADSKHRILSYQPQTGDVEERNSLDGTSALYKRIGLVGIDKVISFKDSAGTPLYAVARASTDGSREVAIYNKKFQTQNTIAFPNEKYPIDMMIGDVNAENAGLEIVVAPQTAGNTVFNVYRMDGSLLYEAYEEIPHTSVQVALVNNDAGSQDVMVLVNTKESVMVERYPNKGDVTAIVVPDYARGGTIATGDIDGDGQGEFILGSGKGQPTALGYYELDGSLKSKFYGYDPGFTGGIRAQILDYDADGAEDVLISALDGTQPVRVWNRKVKRLDNWYPFGEGFRGNFLTISSY